MIHSLFRADYGADDEVVHTAASSLHKHLFLRTAEILHSHNRVDIWNVVNEEENREKTTLEDFSPNWNCPEIAHMVLSRI